MENLIKKNQDELLMDNLLQEAYGILNKSENLNGERETLSRILNQIARWNEDHNCEDQQYYDKFLKVVLAMAQLDFSKRLPIDDNFKSVQNFFSVTINSLNEELEEKIFSRVLVKKLLQGLPLQKTIVIGTSPDGYVNFIYSENNTLLPSFEALHEQHIKVFFDDLGLVHQSLEQNGTGQNISVNMTLGYCGTVSLKVVTASWLLNTEGYFYIITLPDQA